MRPKNLSAFLIASVLLFSELIWVKTPASTSTSTYTVKIDFNVRVKMRDGVELSADVYRPDTVGQFPVILSRTPYNKNGRGALNQGRYFAPYGYVYVAMDVRGRGDSDGKFIPYQNDGIDGYDAIEWCAQQPWSTGKVGTIGGSYLGRIQWLTAVQQPPHLTTMIALVSPSIPTSNGQQVHRFRWTLVGIISLPATSTRIWKRWIGQRFSGICR